MTKANKELLQILTAGLKDSKESDKGIWAVMFDLGLVYGFPMRDGSLNILDDYNRSSSSILRRVKEKREEDEDHI